MDSLEQIKQLREETGVSIAECKKAIEESKGDLEKAKEILRTWGKTLAGKKQSREVKAGMIMSYIHPNKKVGVLLDIRCESDFVVRNENFEALAHEICLQIAAMSPEYVTDSEIPEEILKKEMKIGLEQVAESKKPKEITDQIVEGKLKKFKEEKTLIMQPWIKDDKKTINDLIADYIGKIGENIIIKKFVRYEI